MTLIVLLDAGPLGLVTNPRESLETRECTRWLASLAARGDQIRLPEIANYEVRRELLRAGKPRGIQRLDALKATVAYLPITTAVMLTAAEFWAEARRRGRLVGNLAPSRGATRSRTPGSTTPRASCSTSTRGPSPPSPG